MRALLGIVAVTLALGLSACQDDDKGDDKDKDTKGSSRGTDAPASPSSAGSAGSPGTLTAEEVEQLVLTGAPPKDLTWAVPEVPADWKPQTAEAGEQQWRIGDSPCVVFLRQPAGLGDAKSPTSTEVATEFATKAVSAGNATPEFDAVSEQLFPNLVNAEGVSLKTKFATIHFTAAPGDLEGQVYGYRDGDFALEAIGLCGQGTYPEHDQEIEDFLQGLAARTTY